MFKVIRIYVAISLEIAGNLRRAAYLIDRRRMIDFDDIFAEFNRLADEDEGPVGHPDIEAFFSELKDGRYVARSGVAN